MDLLKKDKHPDKIIECGRQIIFYEDEQKVRLAEKAKIKYKEKDYAMVPYNHIIGYEIIDNGASTLTSGLGRAMVGDLLLGPVGAVIGGMNRKSKSTCSSLNVKVIVKDESVPWYIIKLITTDTKRDAFMYQISLEMAEKAAAKLEMIVRNNDK